MKMRKKEKKPRERRLSPLARDLINFWETSMEYDFGVPDAHPGKPYSDEEAPKRDEDL